MAKPVRMKITYTDGREIEARVGPKAQVMVERKFGVSISQLSGDDATIEQSYYLAWASAHAAKLEHLSFDDFLDVLDDVEPVVDEAAEDPTGDPEAPPGASSS